MSIKITHYQLLIVLIIFKKFCLPYGCHGNKLAFWYFNATSDIQIHGIFTDFLITILKIIWRITKMILIFCFNNLFEVLKNFFGAIRQKPYNGTWLNSSSHRTRKIAADKVNMMDCDPESASETIKFFPKSNLAHYYAPIVKLWEKSVVWKCLH